MVTPPPETVDELQSFIQEQFYIPKCVQKLKLKDSTLLVGSQKLSDVYIRNEDSIIVSYLATAEVELVTRFCQSLHPVVASFRKLFEEGEHLKGYSSINNIGDSAIEHVGGLFHTVAYSCLVPWQQIPEVEANRQFLTQEGGVKLTIELLSFLLETPFSSLNNSLQMLLISCLSLLWNFAETHASRQVVVQLGGFRLMMKALLFHKDQSSHESQQFEMFDLFDHVVGCISK